MCATRGAAARIYGGIYQCCKHMCRGGWHICSIYGKYRRKKPPSISGTRIGNKQARAKRHKAPTASTAAARGTTRLLTRVSPTATTTTRPTATTMSASALPAQGNFPGACFFTKKQGVGVSVQPFVRHPHVRGSKSILSRPFGRPEQFGRRPAGFFTPPIVLIHLCRFEFSPCHFQRKHKLSMMIWYISFV